MKFTKFLAIALSLLMVFGMLASCGRTENPQTTDPAGSSDSQSTEKTDAPASKPVTLKWASWALAEEKLYPTYAAMANTFMDANKDIKIEMDGSQAYSTYLDQLIVSAIGGTAPNVAHIKAEWLPQLLETGAVKAVVGISDAVMKDTPQVQSAASRLTARWLQCPGLQTPKHSSTIRRCLSAQASKPRTSSPGAICLQPLKRSAHSAMTSTVLHSLTVKLRPVKATTSFPHFGQTAANS